MRLVAIHLVLVVFFSAVPVLAAESPGVWRVVKGQSLIRIVPGVSQVAIGDGRVADVKVISRGRELMITGLRAGMTTLSIWRNDQKTDYLVRVLKQDPRLVADDLHGIIKDIPGVTVEIVGERVMLTGQVLNALDFKKVATVAELYPEVLSFIQPNHVDLDQLIRVNVTLVEISRSSGSELGVSWPDSLAVQANVSADSLIGPGVGPLSGTIALSSQLAAALKLLQSQGNARALANPSLVTKNGEQATFHAGGQIPVPVNTGLGQTSIQWQDYGIELGVLPHADTLGNFHLQLELSVSDLDAGNAVQTDAGTIPALRRRATSSHVNLASGESLVLAELVDHREGKVVGKVPGLGHLPFIGELFRTRRLSRQDTEVYILITPTILRPGSLPAGEPDDRRRRYQAADGIADASIGEWK